jgi:hypothetical protein
LKLPSPMLVIEVDVVLLILVPLLFEEPLCEGLREGMTASEK